MSELQVNVADLLLPTGARRRVVLTARVDGLQAGASIVESPLEVDVTLERVSGGVMVSGEVRCVWVAACSRCLAPVDRDLRVPVSAPFLADRGDELDYLLDGVLVDLEPAVRDAVAVQLPLVPLCDPGCRGLCPVCGVDRNEVACECAERPADVRWAALAELETIEEISVSGRAPADDDERARTRGQRSN